MTDPKRKVFTEDATVPASDSVGQGARLLVFGEGEPTSYPLSEGMSYTIGRSLEADIYLKDASLSRLHAVLKLSESGLSVKDLGSSNGTKVGGRLIDPEVEVSFEAGEPIDLGRCTMLVQHGAGSGRPRRVFPHSYFELRLEDFCQRAQAGDEFAILRVRVSASNPQLGAIESAVTALLRADDLISRYAPGQYDVLLTKGSPQEAEEAAAAILYGLKRVDEEVDVGVACHPRDGRVPGELISCLALGDQKKARTDDKLVIEDPAMLRLYELVDRVADSDLGVLILGETGVGKEVMARNVHERSKRATLPFLALNCGAFSAELLESELFGHERGAFTGAIKGKLGLLETVKGGTIFLDELGEMAMATQVKLLRVIEERRLRRLGGLDSIPFEARFIAATNRDLESEVRSGRFREDLYYRMNGFTLVIPPLRERRGEIRTLAHGFAREALRREGRPSEPVFTRSAMQRLTEYAWPGNVRELKNVVVRAVVLAGSSTIDEAHLPMEKLTSSVIFPSTSSASSAEPDPSSRATMPPARAAGTMDEQTLLLGMEPVTRPDEDDGTLQSRLGDVERNAIIDALDKCGGNQTRAAKMLGMSRKTLLRRLDQYDIPRPRKGR